jgi:hypothetical protein
MSTKEESLESTPTPVPGPEHTRQYISRWRTAEERAEALRAKKQRRRAGHRITLRRSHTKG